MHSLIEELPFEIPEDLSLMKMAKIHDRMGDFNKSLKANKKAQNHPLNFNNK